MVGNTAPSPLLRITYVSQELAALLKSDRSIWMGKRGFLDISFNGGKVNVLVSDIN
jgi:hypothetical protein